MKWLLSLFRKPVPAPYAPADAISAEALDALIDRAGSSEVCDILRQNGWSTDNPPPWWAWNVAAMEVLRQRAPLPPYNHKGNQ